MRIKNHKYIFHTYITIFKLAHWLIITSLIYSCAQVVAPNGGPKDSKPPVALNYEPDSATVNFKAKEITIDFNEYVQVKDLSQLIVSPVMEKPPVVKAKGKELTIEFQSPLADSTTYMLNFGGAIADITENNAMENFSYIFSTGNFIDSISLSGKVETAFDHKTEKGILVMLYNDFYDSIPSKKVPNYFTKTKEDGSFRINNIKKGKYKVFALKDANADYLFSTPEEHIAFSDTLIDLEKNGRVNLSLFKEKPKRQFLRKAAAIEFGHLMFTFNKPVDGLNIVPLNFTPKKEWFDEEYSKNRDTVHYWLLGLSAMDTLILQVGDKNEIFDTVEIKTIPREQTGGRSIKLRLTAKTNIEGGKLDLNKKIMIEFNHPVIKDDFSKINFTVDSLTKLSTNSLFFDKIYLRNLSIESYKSDTTYNRDSRIISNEKKSWKENAKYNVFIPPGTFTDIFDLTNDTINLDFKTPELKEYGTLKLKLKLPKKKIQYILQLINDKNNLMKEITLDSSQTIYYDYLKAEKCSLKIIYDENKNGKWDTGDYFKHLQPEKTVFFSAPIEIRANWDIEQEWKVE